MYFGILKTERLSGIIFPQLQIWESEDKAWLFHKFSRHVQWSLITLPIPLDTARFEAIAVPEDIIIKHITIPKIRKKEMKLIIRRRAMAAAAAVLAEF